MHSNRSRTPITERFGRYVYLSLNTGCWEWRGAKNEHGYGVIGKGGGKKSGNIKAHRLSYQIFRHANLAREQFICHRCDNPPCVNPDHLFVGTQRDNIADMIAKGRNSNPPIRYGESNHNAKLTKKSIPKIRRLFKRGTSSRKIARLHSVDKNTILAIINHKTWRHV